MPDACLSGWETTSGVAHGFFEANRWIRQQPRWSQTEYRPHYPSELHKTDPESLRATHTFLRGRLAKLEAGGYEFPSLIMSYTNPWRYHNDQPPPELGDSVDGWNELQLQPAIRLTTVTADVMSMKNEVGVRVPVMRGVDRLAGER